MATIINSNSQTFGNLAVEKLKSEAKKSSGKFIYSEVTNGVLNALIHFCNQSEIFAKVIYETDKTFEACIKVVLHNHGICLSDIEAYRRAVSFYFETADVSFEMIIHLPEEQQKSKPAVILNLFEIL